VVGQGAGVAPQAVQRLVAGGGTGAQGIEQRRSRGQGGVYHGVDRQAHFQFGQCHLRVFMGQRLLTGNGVLRGAFQALRRVPGNGLGSIGLAGHLANHLQQLHVLRGAVGIARREGSGAAVQFVGTTQGGAAGDAGQGAQVVDLEERLAIGKTLVGGAGFIVHSHVVEDAGAAGSQALPKAVPVINDLHAGGLEVDHDAVQRAVVAGADGVDQVAVKGAGGVELFPADAQRTVFGLMDAGFELATGLGTHLGTARRQQYALAEGVQPAGLPVEIF